MIPSRASIIDLPSAKVVPVLIAVPSFAIRGLTVDRDRFRHFAFACHKDHPPPSAYCYICPQHRNERRELFPPNFVDDDIVEENQVQRLSVAGNTGALPSSLLHLSPMEDVSIGRLSDFPLSQEVSFSSLVSTSYLPMSKPDE